MSRAVDAEPMIAPEGPKIGEIADSTTMCLPSLRMQTVSSGSTRSPRLRRSSMSLRRSPLPGSRKLDGAADHLLGAVAEDALGRGVPARHLAVGGARDDRVERRADDGLAREQRRLPLLLLGDVEDVALDAERHAVLVVHEHALVAHPRVGAVAAQHPVLALEALARVDQGGRLRDHTVVVVGMQDLHEEVGVRRPFLGRVAEHLGGLGTDVEARRQGVGHVDVDDQRQPLEQIADVAGGRQPVQRKRGLAIAPFGFVARGHQCIHRHYQAIVQAVSRRAGSLNPRAGRMVDVMRLRRSGIVVAAGALLALAGAATWALAGNDSPGGVAVPVVPPATARTGTRPRHRTARSCSHAVTAASPSHSPRGGLGATSG